MFAIPNCNSIGMQLLCVIAFGITDFPVSGSSVPTNETCVNVSGEIVCYSKGSEKPVTWDKAWRLCSSFNATLPVIRNINDEDAVSKYIQSHVTNSFEVWTAGRKFTHRKWTWIDGTELDGSVQVYSVQRQEDRERDYVAFDSDFNFTSLAASEELPYICQYEGAYCNSSGEIATTNKWLKLINDRRTWYDARHQCLMTNGDLAIIDEENRESLKTMTPNQRYWIGLRKKSWLWIRNDRADFNDEIKYANFQYAKSGECITFDVSGGKWNVVECTRIKGVVCQRGHGGTLLVLTTDTSEKTTNTYTCTSAERDSISYSLFVSTVAVGLCVLVVSNTIVALVSRKYFNKCSCDESGIESPEDRRYQDFETTRRQTNPDGTYAELQPHPFYEEVCQRGN